MGESWGGGDVILHKFACPCPHLSGSIDFCPAQLSAGGFATMAQYEPLSAVLGRVNQWMQQNPALPVTNVQTLDFKMHNTWGNCLFLFH